MITTIRASANCLCFYLGLVISPPILCPVLGPAVGRSSATPDQREDRERERKIGTLGCSGWHDVGRENAVRPTPLPPVRREDTIKDPHKILRNCDFKPVEVLVPRAVVRTRGKNRQAEGYCGEVQAPLGQCETFGA
jgi:hypothetical protein